MQDGAPWALTLEYDGTAFHGWQRQPGRRTVEGELLRALERACGESPALTAAGRTDAGAHAHGQVVGCSLSRPWAAARLRSALNAHLPEDVVVVAAAPVPTGFHARFDAVARAYRYVVTPRAARAAVGRRYAWCVSGPLDVEAMRRAGAALAGTHDFRAFGRSPRAGGSTVRTVRSVSVRTVTLAGAGGVAVLVDVVADAFLYGMMRAIVGALVAAGRGRLAVEEVAVLVLDPPSVRPALPVAPAHGLHQWRVDYGDLQTS